MIGLKPSITPGPWRWESKGTDGGAFFWNKDRERFGFQEGSEIFGDEALYKRIGEAAHNGLREELIEYGLHSLEVQPVCSVKK